MCKYTYHHDPNCGHITSFNVDICSAFTCSLRQVEDGRPILCTKPTYKHDLVHPSKPSLCVQCERDWVENVKTKVQFVNDKSEGGKEPGFVSLEGMSSPIEVGMTVFSQKDRVNEHIHANAHYEGGEVKDKGKQSDLSGLGISSGTDAVHVDGNPSITSNACSLDCRGSADSGTFDVIDGFLSDFSSINIEDSPCTSDHADTYKDGDGGSDYDEYECFDLSPVSSLAEESFHDASADLDYRESFVYFGHEYGEKEDTKPQIDSRTQNLDEPREITSNTVPSIKQICSSLWKYLPSFGFSGTPTKVSPDGSISSSQA